MPYGRMATDRFEGINYERMRNYRLNRAKEVMKKHGIDMLVTFDYPAIRYITGAYCTPAGRWAEGRIAVLPVNGDPYLFNSTSFSPYKIREEMPWMKGRIWPGPVAYSRAKLSADAPIFVNFAERIKGYMEDNHLTGGTVGLDGTVSFHLYSKAFENAGLKVVDARQVMYECFLIKSQDEIECIRQSASIAEGAFDAMREAIRPGIRECDLMGIGAKRLYELGADEVQEFVIASGPRTNPLHIDFTDRQVRPGDLVVIDINAACFQGYKSCYYRTFCCGRATQEQKDCFEECREMLYEGMSAVKNGAIVQDIIDKWPSSPQHWGYESWSDVSAYACGHGIGLSLHEFPGIGHLGPDMMQQELKTGMVFALETWTGKKGGDFGVRLEEYLAVTDTGYDLLTKYPIDHHIECNPY